MHPPESNLKLTEKEKSILKLWIAQGANWEPHWSYTKPLLPKVPKTVFESWSNNEIDFFIAKKLEKKGMVPSNLEKKEILIRRVSFDLTGLPPSVKEIDDFLADNHQMLMKK